MFRNAIDAVLKFFWSFFVQPHKEPCGTTYHDRIEDQRFAELYQLRLMGSFGVEDVMRVRECCKSTASSWLGRRVADKTIVRVEEGLYRVV